MSGQMKYHFIYRTTASDIWQLSMYGTYGSIIGVTNLVFTAAMVLLAVRFFTSVHIVLKCLIIAGISLFTVIQPLLVYLRAKKQADKIPGEINLEFDDQGMHISLGDQKQDIDWNDVKGVIKKPTLLVILSSAQHGFVLNNKVLGDKKEEFYNYICSKIKQNK